MRALLAAAAVLGLGAAFLLLLRAASPGRHAAVGAARVPATDRAVSIAPALAAPREAGAPARTLLGIAGRAPVASTPSAAPLPIAVTRNASIEGVVLLDDDVPRAALRLALRPDGSDAVVRDQKLMVANRISLSKLAPGTYTLEVRVDGEDAPLVTLDAIQVESGAIVRPPELDPLDLRRRIRRHEIAVIDAGGRPLDATVYFRGAGTERSGWVTAALRAGAPAVAFSCGDAIDVTAAAPEHGWAERRGASGAATLLCGPTHAVRLRLAAGVEVPEGRSLSASLVPSEHAGRAGMRSAPAAFDEHGTCVLQAKGVGPHDVELGLDGFLVLPRAAWGGNAPTVDVGAFGARELIVAVPPAAFEAAFEIFAGLICPGE